MDVTLSALLPDYSRSRIQDWIRQKEVKSNGQPVTAKQRVSGGERIEIILVPHPSEQLTSAEDIALDVVFEDDSLLVVNKPAGLVVHPGSGNWQGTMMNGLLHHAPALAQIPRAGIVHRLDKDTSGLLVVAKTLPAQTALVRQLQARRVKRQYLAVVEGRVVCDGRVDAPIGRHPVQRTLMSVQGNGKEAITHYAVEQQFARHALLRCTLETGRTHQIRVHMQHIGHPLVGDSTYNRRRAQVLLCGEPFSRQALHATQLGLLHPVTGEPMQWQCHPPADFLGLLHCLSILQERTHGELDIS